MESRIPPDRRREPRKAVSAYGRIWYGPQYGLWADCKISDRSTSGARIEISAIYRLPRRLIFAQHFERHAAGQGGIDDLVPVTRTPTNRDGQLVGYVEGLGNGACGH